MIHLIYNSAAVVDFGEDDLLLLLRKARDKNAALDITGMLLFVDGSFFQILEGPEEAVDSLAAKIAEDPRHDHMTVIIREPIARRAFQEWTMGFGQVDGRDLSDVDGMNDFFDGQRSLQDLDAGRAKKLLAAFGNGRWRVRLAAKPPKLAPQETESAGARTDPRPGFSFAFQPIVDAAARQVGGYEAHIRGPADEPAAEVLQRIPLDEIGAFETDARRMSIGLASRLDLQADLHMTMVPQGSWMDINANLASTIETARRCTIDPSRLVVELKHETTLKDPAALADCLKDARREGLRISIGDFGSGHAGLALLDHYQPELISLSMWLVQGIDGHGPRQAIVRGLVQTCGDLGIDIVAKGVETVEEFSWLADEGVELFQGNLFAAPGFESLPRPMLPVG